jgi:hypothetical protein
LDLPAKTTYTLTYKATNQAEVWEGAVHLVKTRRMFILNMTVCVLVALIVASKVSLAAFLATFFCGLIVVTLFQFLICLYCVLMHTLSVVFLSKLNLECTTTIDEDGIRDSLGLVKFNYKWHQVRDVQIEKGSVYAIALLSGIHIPSCAFASRGEAEEVFALAQQYKEAAQQKKNQISVANGTNVEDPDFLLKSLQEEEEAQWREIEDKHKQQNRE